MTGLIETKAKHIAVSPFVSHDAHSFNHLQQQQQQPHHPHAAQLQMQMPHVQFYPAQMAPQAPDPYAAQQVNYLLGLATCLV